MRLLKLSTSTRFKKTSYWLTSLNFWITFNKIFFKKFYKLSNIKFNLFNNLTSYTNLNFNIFFLKKDKLYTKLKYSRVTQYDISSGGIAALFSGFLGFLICEKFGFELLDSCDFYILFMYIVFICYLFRIIFKLSTFPIDRIYKIFLPTYLFKIIYIYFNNWIYLIKNNFKHK